MFNSNDIGLYMSAETEDWVKAKVVGCTFTDNTDGTWIEDVGDSVVVIDNCTITNSTTTGIYVSDPGDVRITRNTITGGTIGIYSDSSSTAQIRSRNVIQDNAGGIKSDHYSVAVVESCTVTDNTNGVVVINDASPDLGHVSGGGSLGGNILNQNTAYFVSNLTSNSIKAENNYWGGGSTQNPNCYPKASKISGSVDHVPSLCTAPALTSIALLIPSEDQETHALPKLHGLGQNYPNPFNPTTTVSYEVPPPGAHVRIELYDVAGRLVATLVNEEKLAGTYETVWKGRNHRGQPVASGVYFLRMRAGSFVQTRKLVVLK